MAAEAATWDRVSAATYSGCFVAYHGNFKFDTFTFVPTPRVFGWCTPDGTPRRRCMPALASRGWMAHTCRLLAARTR